MLMCIIQTSKWWWWWWWRCPFWQYWRKWKIPRSVFISRSYPKSHPLFGVPRSNNYKKIM